MKVMVRCPLCGAVFEIDPKVHRLCPVCKNPKSGLFDLVKPQDLRECEFPDCHKQFRPRVYGLDCYYCDEHAQLPGETKRYDE